MTKYLKVMKKGKSFRKHQFAASFKAFVSFFLQAQPQKRIELSSPKKYKKLIELKYLHTVYISFKIRFKVRVNLSFPYKFVCHNYLLFRDLDDSSDAHLMKEKVI